MQVLRDLILSFRLPRDVVGVRRSCVLGRDVSKTATEKYTDLLGAAHDAAMRGARWTFAHDENEVHRMCALLAGLAIALCTTPQGVRKDDMFGGRISLPFLETTPPDPGCMRMALLPHKHEWVVYTINASGVPTVQLRHPGYDGMRHASVLFASRL